MEGLLLVDKPKGWSSFDVIRKLRQVAGVKKIGHAGTLDPLATGLLLVLIGRATKQAQRLVKLDKTYLAEITLGATSATDDAEGKLTPVTSSQGPVARKPKEAEVSIALEQFIGTIKQTPPAFSAIKVGGQRAYKLAREGKVVEMRARNVKIYSLKLLEYDFPRLKIEAKVSSGTYIRSLARDVGQSLGAGGYLSGLIRTKVGNYDLAQAVDPRRLNRASLKQALQSLK